MRARAVVLVVAALASAPLPCTAQSVLDRPPNVGGDWVGDAGAVYFHFLHRFSVVGDVKKVINSPSFLLAAGLPGRLLAGLVYATNSDISPEVRPNEWEFFARWQPLLGDSFPVRLTLQGGYNAAVRSGDGELVGAGDVGPFTLVGSVRGLSRPFAAGSPRVALSGGAVWRFGRWAAFGADVASFTDRRPGERAAWSAGFLLAIPHTPHSFSLHATNANTTTLQGASRGGDEVRWGFEFTVPLTLRRYLGGRSSAAAAPASPPPVVGTRASPAAGMDTLHVAIEALEYAPARIEVEAGTTVVWTNRDPLVHTVTADDGTWGSPDIEPGEQWAHTFVEAGEYPFHCAPHPFMKGVVVVRER